jgi:hypothetical protein
MVGIRRHRVPSTPTARMSNAEMAPCPFGPDSRPRAALGSFLPDCSDIGTPPVNLSQYWSFQATDTRDRSLDFTGAQMSKPAAIRSAASLRLQSRHARTPAKTDADLDGDPRAPDHPATIAAAVTFPFRSSFAIDPGLSSGACMVGLGNRMTSRSRQPRGKLPA